MSLEIFDSLRVKTSKPVEDKRLNNGKPYTSVNEVNSLIPKIERYQSLEVFIDNEIYWYKEGIQDENLIKKDSTNTAGLIPYKNIKMIYYSYNRDITKNFRIIQTEHRNNDNFTSGIEIKSAKPILIKTTGIPIEDNKKILFFDSTSIRKTNGSFINIFDIEFYSETKDIEITFFTNDLITFFNAKELGYRINNGTYIDGLNVNSLIGNIKVINERFSKIVIGRIPEIYSSGVDTTGLTDKGLLFCDISKPHKIDNNRIQRKYLFLYIDFSGKKYYVERIEPDISLMNNFTSLGNGYNSKWLEFTDNIYLDNFELTTKINKLNEDIINLKTQSSTQPSSPPSSSPPQNVSDEIFRLKNTTLHKNSTLNLNNSHIGRTIIFENNYYESLYVNTSSISNLSKFELIIKNPTMVNFDKPTTGTSFHNNTNYPFQKIECFIYENNIIISTNNNNY